MVPVIVFLNLVSLPIRVVNFTLMINKIKTDNLTFLMNQKFSEILKSIDEKTENGSSKNSSRKFWLVKKKLKNNYRYHFNINYKIYNILMTNKIYNI